MNTVLLWVIKVWKQIYGLLFVFVAERASTSRKNAGIRWRAANGGKYEDCSREYGYISFWWTDDDGYEMMKPKNPLTVDVLLNGSSRRQVVVSRQNMRNRLLNDWKNHFHFWMLLCCNILNINVNNWMGEEVKDWVGYTNLLRYILLLSWSQVSSY